MSIRNIDGNVVEEILNRCASEGNVIVSRHLLVVCDVHDARILASSPEGVLGMGVVGDCAPRDSTGDSDSQAVRMERIQEGLDIPGLICRLELGHDLPDVVAQLVWEVDDLMRTEHDGVFVSLNGVHLGS